MREIGGLGFRVLGFRGFRDRVPCGDIGRHGGCKQRNSARAQANVASQRVPPRRRGGGGRGGTRERQREPRHRRSREPHRPPKILPEPVTRRATGHSRAARDTHGHWSRSLHTHPRPPATRPHGLRYGDGARHGTERGGSGNAPRTMSSRPCTASPMPKVPHFLGCAARGQRAHAPAPRAPPPPGLSLSSGQLRAAPPRARARAMRRRDRARPPTGPHRPENQPERGTRSRAPAPALPLSLSLISALLLLLSRERGAVGAVGAVGVSLMRAGRFDFSQYFSLSLLSLCCLSLSHAGF
eukprot:346090-Chlamydomonas_euryale.AAC.16